MARKNALIAVSRDETTNALTFTVGNAGSFALDVTGLPDDVRTRAMLHGIVQKVSDAAAMPKDELKGKSDDEIATLKFNAMSSVADRLREGDWSKRSGDGTGPVAGVIYRAFEEWVNAMAAKAKKDAPTPEAIRARYDAMDRSQQLALRNVPAIAKIVERIKSERGTKAQAIDAEGLLGELGL